MPNPTIGEIIMFAGAKELPGWAFCDGRLLSVEQDNVLFMVIGTTYGGDGVNTFALPDLRGRMPLGAGQGQGLSQRSLGQAGGTETVTLGTAQLPAHTHAARCNSKPGEIPTPTNAVWAGATDQTPYTTDVTNLLPMGHQVQETGGNQPHENRMPYQSISFLIALFGDFPVSQ